MPITVQIAKASYSHHKIVPAYNSLRRNSPYLFTYQKYTDFIRDTTRLVRCGWVLFEVG